MTLDDLMHLTDDADRLHFDRDVVGQDDAEQVECFDCLRCGADDLPAQLFRSRPVTRRKRGFCLLQRSLGHWHSTQCHWYDAGGGKAELKAQGRSSDDTATTVQQEFQATHPDWPRGNGLAADH